jgi:hypothetical protein
MTRILAAIFLCLSLLPAAAGEIDYFCLFTNAAAAQADANVGAFWNTTSLAWDTSTTFPGIAVSTAAPTIRGVNPNTGFWIMVSRTSDSVGLDTSCVMALDRDLGKNNGSFVLFADASLNGTARTGLNFAPVPHGSGYPRPLGK